jgi:uncharacterized protein YciI
LITLDTTRADRLGSYGWAEATTPALDGLAASGRRYARAYSPLPLTIPAHASVMTGQYPPRHGIRRNGDRALDPSFTTLAELLHDAGWRTAASTAAFVTTRRWGFDQGFDAYFDQVPSGDDVWHAERPGAAVVDDALVARFRQEAVAAGVMSVLTDDDQITSTHRGHGHAIAKGAEFRPMFAELYGKTTGYCKGRGGSMHIVELPDAETAQVFAHEDPLAIGGVFASIAVRRFENLAGRTMWQFAGDGTKKRFLFVGERDAATPAPVKAAISAQGDWLGHGEAAANMIVFGSLLGTDGATWEGTVMLLEAADLAEAQAIPAADPLAGHYTRRALHPWRFGGQENLKDLLASR